MALAVTAVAAKARPPATPAPVAPLVGGLSFDPDEPVGFGVPARVRLPELQSWARTVELEDAPLVGGLSFDPDEPVGFGVPARVRLPELQSWARRWRSSTNRRGPLEQGGGALCCGG